jgi:drug/metabolite transporter (DMT)-like permease
MHHPVAVTFYAIVMVFMIAVIVTKRPHNLWMKVGMVALILGINVISLYGMAHTNPGIAVLFAVTLSALVAWKTVRKGWDEWWRQL